MNKKLPAFVIALVLTAAALIGAPAKAVAGQPCNQTTCGPREFCCNFSCSICAPIGGFCTQQFCG